eukprot:CAMPEP_0175748460 /NCGR_PEP_ID=MMETSP0097-20121207/59632_1 /TAXON_ID=311494 /ORGANISM="Alexandrium monilatum, Strain CCMP3105" /LENGTH=45 /DNA_ID= /DNA_START= /DNA_END= /DNA_ORIENTATION=
MPAHGETPVGGGQNCPWRGQASLAAGGRESYGLSTGAFLYSNQGA